ncbi:MAG: hypothetical protein AW09_003858 [Candidatus Accumulibacter phosphatis]|uniref:Uncharacterized protein n=1 Tax=Candidatus Accumulibacter phosphatis TaxID=327160 RepID=A0A080M1G1_9PROT|nr:MAG: hypothetical protein AW09_003858 [Candidatus Accumulibacter phosphatis]
MSSPVAGSGTAADPDVTDSANPAGAYTSSPYALSTIQALAPLGSVVRKSGIPAASIALKTSESGKPKISGSARYESIVKAKPA